MGDHAMTTKQALKKAVGIWGKTAMVEDHKKPTTTKRKDGRTVVLAERYRVGKVMFGMFFEVKGDGDTWEAAFASAERREERWKQKQ